MKNRLLLSVFTIAAVLCTPVLQADDKPPRKESRESRGGERESAERRQQLLEQMRKRRGESPEHREREVREHVERREREARKHGQREDAELEAAERRMHHLREAAENLAAAGKRDVAEQLHREANEIQRHLEERARQKHHGRPGEHAPSNAELAEMVQDLRNHVRELTEIVHHLRRELAERR